MNEQENTRIVRRSYELFKSGDIQALLDLFSEDIDFQLPEIENVPFSGRHEGPEATARFFKLVSESQDVLEFNSQEFIAQGDVVWFLVLCVAGGQPLNSGVSRQEESLQFVICTHEAHASAILGQATEHFGPGPHTSIRLSTRSTYTKTTGVRVLVLRSCNGSSPQQPSSSITSWSVA